MKKQDIVTYVLVLIFVIITLVLIGLSFLDDDSEQDKNNEEEVIQQVIEEDFLLRSDIQNLPIEDTKNISIGSKTVVLPGEFEVNAVLEIASTYPDFECLDSGIRTGCKLFFVSNGSNEYIISTPGAVANTNVLGDTLTGSITIDNKTIDITSEIVDTSSLEDLSELEQQNAEERSVMIRQSYGCIEEDICVSSNIMDIFTENTELTLFNNFLTDLVINGE